MSDVLGDKAEALIRFSCALKSFKVPGSIIHVAGGATTTA